MPFIIDQKSHIRNNEFVSFFTPSRLIIFVSAIAMAYNYEMWNIIFIQMSFFMTLFILASSIHSDDSSEYRLILRPLLLFTF